MDDLVVQDCALFRETLAQYPEAKESLAKFIAFKRANPLQPYGKSDKTSPTSTPLPQYIPKIRHAHIYANDVSVFYTLEGRNPRVLKLYAILSHDKSGTGQPPEPRKQRSLGQAMQGQRF